MAETSCHRSSAGLRVSAISATLGSRRAVTNVSFQVPSGSWTAIIGPNGAGKTTLLRCIAGLIDCDGDIEWSEKNIRTWQPKLRAQHIAYAPQVPVLPEQVSVAHYVSLARTAYHGILSGPSHRDRNAVQQAMSQLELVEFADRPLRTLSGGERQRVVLARVLAQQPQLVLLDEPTAALDIGHAQTVFELIDQLRRHCQLTVVTTIHDLAFAAQYADQLVLLDEGRLADSGTPQQVLTAERLHRHYGVTADISHDAAGITISVRRPGTAASS